MAFDNRLSTSPVDMQMSSSNIPIAKYHGHWPWFSVYVWTQADVSLQIGQASANVLSPNPSNINNWSCAK